ncbi:thioredoxin domain-containing protein [Lactobacillus agrestimuris]|uniref:thioredoxin domain-containing protein n=1 Tax=Lactobacillus agrestimuris TaxID=2941328 RepID=UPI0020445828|nr:thioredoxin domain-containing protein [Lactobacillus agrestimuris]
MEKRKLIALMVSPIALLMMGTSVVNADEVNSTQIESRKEVNLKNNISNESQTQKINDSEKNESDDSQSSSDSTANDLPSNDKKDDNQKVMEDQEKDSDDESNDEEDITIDEYYDNVENMQHVNIAQVKELIGKKDNQEQLLYIGRPTCYYCRQFSPVLKDFNELVKGKLFYFDIDAEKGAHEYAFKDIGIPGTPTTMRFMNGQIISAWIGGEKTAKELYDFLYSSESNKIANSLIIEEKMEPSENNILEKNNAVESTAIDYSSNEDILKVKPNIILTKAYIVMNSTFDINRMVSFDLKQFKIDKIQHQRIFYKLKKGLIIKVVKQSK